MSLASHAPHVVLVVGGAVVLLAGTATQVRGGRRIARLRRSSTPEDLIAAAELRGARALAAEPGRTALAVSATATAFAAFVHATVVPEHLGEATRLGLFFLTLAVLQAALAGGQLRGSVSIARRRIVAVSGLVNAATVGLWVVSRTMTFPLGPDDVEHVGVLDALCSATEVLAVVCAVAWLRANRTMAAPEGSPAARALAGRVR